MKKRNKGLKVVRWTAFWELFFYVVFAFNAQSLNLFEWTSGNKAGFSFVFVLVFAIAIFAWLFEKESL